MGNINSGPTERVVLEESGINDSEQLKRYVESSVHIVSPLAYASLQTVRAAELLLMARPPKRNVDHPVFPSSRTLYSTSRSFLFAPQKKDNLWSNCSHKRSLRLLNRFLAAEKGSATREDEQGFNVAHLCAMSGWEEGLEAVLKVMIIYWALNLLHDPGQACRGRGQISFHRLAGRTAVWLITLCWLYYRCRLASAGLTPPRRAIPRST
jgi:hypothetical protein